MTGGHWLQLAVVGDDGSNRAGIGATIEVTAGARTWLRHIGGGTGQGCQDSLIAHVGLGAVSEVDTISVVYPGGRTVTHDGPHDADQRLWLYESGSTASGWSVGR